MTVAELLAHLRSLDVKVWADNGQLHCDGPKGALTPQLRAVLNERKTDILAFLHSAAGAARHDKPPLQRVPREGNLPLSFAQQRLWFLDQLEPDGSVYNVPIGLRLRGPLNVESLERSLNEIVRRHEVLRASFPSVGGYPLQLISPSLILSLPLVDLTDHPAAERENEAQRLANEEAERSFDLARGPLLRATLLRLASEDHVLLLTLHHIVSDEWSMGVLYRELTALYEAFGAGKPSPLAELPIQYVDFARWQSDWLQGEALDQQLSYWKKQLEGIPTMQLPTDRPRPAAQSFRGACQSIVLSKELTAAVKAHSRRERATLFMTLLAVFQVLLYRHTGQEDIVVGSPIANRGRVEFEGLIGFFLNTLVLRTDLSGNPSFLTLLARVREVALEAYAHQDLPFENLVEELKPERLLNQTPLFQVLFVFQNDGVRDLKLSGLTPSRFTAEINTAKFDLSLFMADTEQGLIGKVQYNTDLFDADTMGRMLEHFQTLLEVIVANPGQRLSDVPLLSEAECRQLLVHWNNTKRGYPKDKCVHQLFEAQAERSPEAIAVVFENQTLTYRELSRQANQLAHYLRSLGVGPEVRVAICVERSLEMVVSVLASLKAGGAYVPLDPAYPKERLAFMLEDAQAKVLLTQKSLVDLLPANDAQVICLDIDWEMIARENETAPVSNATAESLVYVIYTSGSTGKPKAVALPHRTLSNLIAWQIDDLSHGEASRTLQFTSLSFDVSFQEIFTTWCSGGTLVIPPKAVRQDISGLACFIAERNIDRIFLPFVALQQLAEAINDQNQLTVALREIITAGEQLHVTRPIIKLFSQLKHCSFHNQYGPSESHVVTAYTLTGTPEDWPALPPIGRPVANTQIYLLDGRLQPVPLGVIGELYIGGEGMARGYLNRPDITAEKFIPNPFSDKRGARLYKTGDLARYLPEGNIEFFGRIDHQVKIRGFRIELGEIEAVLGQHAAVREAVVIAREDRATESSTLLREEKRLVAYVVPHQGQALTVDGLRSFLKRKLPDYMIPSAFVFLDSLPLTPNGKVDRRALPAPAQSRPELEEALVSPRTTVEKVIAAIWAEVLKLEQVGIHDNFFDLGGHSLLATQVVSRLRHALQVELPLRALFESPTVASLAVRITEMQARRTVPKELAEVLADLESLSDEEARHLLAQESPKEI